MGQLRGREVYFNIYQRSARELPVTHLSLLVWRRTKVGGGGSRRSRPSDRGGTSSVRGGEDRLRGCSEKLINRSLLSDPSTSWRGKTTSYS